MFTANWTNVLFTHFAVDPAALQPSIPYELDTRNGLAYFSLVAFTQGRLRPRLHRPTRRIPQPPHRQPRIPQPPHLRPPQRPPRYLFHLRMDPQSPRRFHRPAHVRPPVPPWKPAIRLHSKHLQRPRRCAIKKLGIPCPLGKLLREKQRPPRHPRPLPPRAATPPSPTATPSAAAYASDTIHGITRRSPSTSSTHPSSPNSPGSPPPSSSARTTLPAFLT